MEIGSLFICVLSGENPPENQRENSCGPHEHFGMIVNDVCLPIEVMQECDLLTKVRVLFVNI